jgi:glycosyltransferase involved in cell wall biosynthesis
MPPGVTDYYGESAFMLMHKLTKFESVVDSCDDSIDIIFNTCFIDYNHSNLNLIFKRTYKNNVLTYEKKYPDKVYINYFWDLPFWRANDKTIKRKYFILKEPSWEERYIAYLRSGDILVSSSSHTKKEVFNAYGIDSEVLYLYFPNIDIDQIKYDGKKKNQIICVGRIEPFKRCDVLIKAMSLLENPPELFLVGKGSEKNNCLELADKLKIKVISPGWLDRVATIREIKSSIMSVNPSIMEGNCGWCPCEAAWAGIPSVMADIPETQEFFKDKGIYFKKDDPESLAEQIRSILNKNQDGRDEIAKDQREQISFYTVDEGIKRLEKFIKDVAKKYLM